jgi:hypothetical protein
MRTVAAALLLIGLVASPLAAQQRGGRYGVRAQGIPPGHLPPPGECRVWYDGRPAGQQPPPTSCREAERVAGRDRYARVVYGGDRDRRDDEWWDRDDDRRDRGRAVPRGERYPAPERYPSPDRYPYPESRSPYPNRYPNERGGYGYGSVPFDNGYKDGYDKGREDAGDNDQYDPVRHSRYRSADRGYDRRYGTKEEYKGIYREGFQAGYDEGYRGTGASGSDRPGGRIRLPWPF